MTILSAAGAAGVTGIAGAVWAYNSISDWLGHHPGDRVRTLAGIDVIVREQALNWNAHKLRLTIIWSPEGRVNDGFAEKHTWHARSSRKECLRELETVVAEAYPKK